MWIIDTIRELNSKNQYVKEQIELIPVEKIMVGREFQQRELSQLISEQILEIESFETTRRQGIEGKANTLLNSVGTAIAALSISASFMCQNDQNNLSSSCLTLFILLSSLLLISSTSYAYRVTKTEAIYTVTIPELIENANNCSSDTEFVLAMTNLRAQFLEANVRVLTIKTNHLCAAEEFFKWGINVLGIGVSLFAILYISERLIAAYPYWLQFSNLLILGSVITLFTCTPFAIIFFLCILIKTIKKIWFICLKFLAS